MKASIDKKWNSAFVLTREELKQIGLIYSSYNISPSIRVECYSGLSLKPDGFEQLLDLNNSGMSCIKSIRFESPYKSLVDLTIEFSCGGYRTISLSVSGEQHEVVSVAASVTNVAESCSVWYGQLARDYTAVKGVIWIAIILSGFISIDAHHFYTAFVLFFISLLSFNNPNKMFSWLYPLGLFEIGKGSQQISEYGRRRSQFGFGALGLALLSGLFIAYLAHRLGW